MEWMQAPVSVKHLFDLTHALNPEEIAFLEQAPHISIKWKQLLRQYLTYQNYDEDDVQQALIQISDTPKIAVNDLAIACYRCIVEEISPFHTKMRAVQMKLMDHINVLIGKKQYDIALHLLKEAKQKAEWHEDLFILYLILDRKRTLLARVAPNTITIRRELIQVNKQLINFLEYESIMEEVLLLSNEFKINPTSEQRIRYTHMLHYPSLQQEKKALSIKAKIQYNLALALIHYSLHAYENALVHFERTIELYEEHWERLKMESNIRRYIAIYNNYLSVSISVKKYEQALQIIKQIKDIPQRVAAMEKSPHLQAYLFYATRISELTIYCSTAAYTKGYELINEIYDCIEGLTISPVFEYGFYMYAAETCLVLKKYEECMDWTAKIIAAKDKKLSMIEDNIAKSYIFNVLIAIEQKDQVATLMHVKIFKQFLHVFKRRSGFELLFTSFVESLLRVKREEEEEQQQIYQENIPIMQAFLSKSPFHGRYVKFDIVGWMESQWRKVPFIMVLKEKVHIVLTSTTK